mgnify:CR=1 FL=1
MYLLNTFKNLSLVALLASTLAFTACDDDEVDAPHEENEEEVITDIKLTFTNTQDANDVVTASAQDPDGEGIEELVIAGDISLDVDKSYTLTLEVENNLESPGEDIAVEIEEEGDEHQLFYSFSNDAFTNPAGSGNINNASGTVAYNDMDANGNPLGLSTSWTTSSTVLENGSFTVRLQHQPDLKTATSGATDGDTDFELTFVLNIK